MVGRIFLPRFLHVVPVVLVVVVVVVRITSLFFSQDVQLHAASEEAGSAAVRSRGARADEAAESLLEEPWRLGKGLQAAVKCRLSAGKCDARIHCGGTVPSRLLIGNAAPT